MMPLPTENAFAGDHALSAMSPLRYRLMRQLCAEPEGLSLNDLVGASGRNGKAARASVMSMLLRLRAQDMVVHVEGKANAPRGRLYRVTAKGMSSFVASADAMETLSLSDDEPVLETGAMRGETGIVVIRSAADTPPVVPRLSPWIFGFVHQP